jgi:hypothetical protein
MNIVSIDIGLKNLGMVEFWWDEHPRHFPELEKWHRVDLTEMPHKRVDFHKCDIPHTNEMADLVAHFMQEYHPIFEKADVILLERQPPGGLLEIQSLLLFKYRRKAQLVSPNSVHAHFTMNHLDYEGRKERSLALARHRHPGTIPETSSRWHDVSDAILFAHFWCSRQRVPQTPEVQVAFEEFRLERSPTSSNFQSLVNTED